MEHRSYTTITEALQDLAKRGYTLDFSLLPEQDCMYCHSHDLSLQADEFVIDEVHRFEGDTDPGDETILYAISSTQHARKGTLLNAYGIYADIHHAKLVEKLQYQTNHTPKPLKRAKELVQLSREHHHALLLSWKIKTGMAKHIAAERIQAYVRWFYTTYLASHFTLEETYIFPLLGADHPKRELALQQHAQIRALVETNSADYQHLTRLQNLLTAHIRLEERELFKDIQEAGVLERIAHVESLQQQARFIENNSDPFWI